MSVIKNTTTVARFDNGNMYVYIVYDKSDNVIVTTDNGYFSSTVEYFLSNGILMGFINGQIVEYLVTLKTWNDIRDYMGYKKIKYEKYQEMLKNVNSNLKSQLYS